jgi:hypothetical protein
MPAFEQASVIACPRNPPPPVTNSFMRCRVVPLQIARSAAARASGRECSRPILALLPDIDRETRVEPHGLHPRGVRQARAQVEQFRLDAFARLRMSGTCRCSSSTHSTARCARQRAVADADERRAPDLRHGC